MRDIKFRGKRIDTGGWVYGCLLIEVEGCFISYQLSKLTEPEHNFYDIVTANKEVYPETVGQFTGLKDREGKEIFEGDVITYKDYTNGAVLSFTGEDKQPRRTSVIKLDNIITGFKAYGMADFDVRHIKVIGNIHENPELLKSK